MVRNFSGFMQLRDESENVPTVGGRRLFYEFDNRIVAVDCVGRKEFFKFEWFWILAPKFEKFAAAKRRITK